MSMKDLLLAEFDQEMGVTRKLLERVPLDPPDWRPHPKSAAIQGLASHVANLPAWLPLTLDHSELDLMPGGVPWKTPQLATTADLVAAFDHNCGPARTSLANATADRFDEPWSLLANGHLHFTMPKIKVLRYFVFSHLVHHRAQLGVYLRLREVPVPMAYGPTADGQPGR